MKKPKISAEVSQDEFDAYKSEAGRMGMNFSEWIRRSLNSTLPTRRAAPAVAEAAFQQLEDQGENGVMVPIEHVVQKPQPVLQTMPKPPPAPGHPCVYLNLQRPGVLTTGECEGTCMAASQRGKPCFFAAGNARNCSQFAGRVVPPPPVNDMRARK